MNDIWWDVLAVYAGYDHSFAGCGIIVMPLGTVLFSQFKLPVSGISVPSRGWKSLNIWEQL